MNIRDLKYLVALYEHKHFGNAAQSCHVSQPTLSTQIKKLEDLLGGALVERDNKTVMFTELGLQVLEQAREVLNNVEAIENIARAAKDPSCGTLRLGLIPTIGPYLLPYAVRAIKQQMPNLSLYLHEAQTHKLIAKLKSGKLDAAIMALPIEDERLEFKPMYAEAFFAAVPMNHPLSSRELLTVDDLSGVNLLLLKEGHCLRDQALEVCRHADTKELQDFKATSLETLRQMVVAGEGVTLLPTLAAESQYSQHGVDLNIIAFDQPKPKRDVAIFYRPSSPNKELYRQIGNIISRRLPKGLASYLTVYEQEHEQAN